MMSRISINLKRAGDHRLDDDTTRSALESVRFARHGRGHEQDHPFDMSFPKPPRLSAHQRPLPPSPSTADNLAECISFSKAGQHDFAHKPTPMVVAPEIIHHDIV